MKFLIPVACSACGCDFSGLGYGEENFPPAVCPKCGSPIHIVDPLSISVVAERLLYRSQRELAEADYTVSIICSAMAVECALTQVFLKWKAIDQYRVIGRQPTDDEQEAWEREYRKGTAPAGFEKAASFVSQFIVGKKYDEFVGEFIARNDKAVLAKAGFPQNQSEIKVNHIHKTLFVRRNRIMHWGEVSYTKDEASNALLSAATAISVLKAMDKDRCEAMEKEFRASLGHPEVK